MSCPDCQKGAILLGKPTGSIVDGAYLAAGPEGNTTRAIIVVTDIFGLPLPNCKLLADHFSKSLNCDVWVPDIFDGNPPFRVDTMKNMKTPERAGEKLEWLPFLFGLIPVIPALYRSRPSVASTRARTFIETLQAKKKYGKLGAVGYCYGGTVAINLASTDLINSAVVCHPGSGSEKEVQAIKVPTSWACAEDDMSFKPKLRKRAEEIFESRRGKDNFVEYEFQDYKGTAHGFANRPNLSYPEVKAGHEGALLQTVKWFDKTLPV